MILRKSLPMKRGRNGSYEYEPQSKKDDSLQTMIATIKEMGHTVDETGKEIKDMLDIQTSWYHQKVARFMGWLLPNSMKGVLPKSLQRIIAEDGEILEYMETLLRENVNNSQNAAVRAAECALTEEKKLDELKGDLKEVSEENWDAAELQNYIAQKSGIKIHEQVANLLAKEFSVLSDEEKEESRQWLLKELQGTIANKEELQKLLNVVSASGLKIFQAGLTQFYGYTNAYRPFIEIRNSAKTMTELNKSIYAAKDALCLTLDRSVGAVTLILKTLEHVSAYDISAPEMKEFIQEKRLEIEQAIKSFNETQRERMAVVTEETREIPALIEGAMEEPPSFNTAEKEKVPVVVRSAASFKTGG